MTEKKDPVENAIELAKPLLAQLSFGAAMGYCSGMAMKKVGKAVAFGVGVIFIGLQAAASTGYIAVDWAKISDDTMKKLDTTGDGKVDAEDLKLYWKKLKALLVNKLPSSSGFSLGFLYGVRYG
ncbi:FUN14 family [Seminavis robusta]|uniref:FUN14 family n=1 Tax=Seminavis robusta TaxID=568900 RepID=A0A9N8HWH2_9STRA|nr:FUN14 family [Seminavis robusta]|eukprot:Sro2653_g333770.1 FUN14 family (124) ;mRNA; r:6601-7158